MYLLPSDSAVHASNILFRLRSLIYNLRNIFFKLFDANQIKKNKNKNTYLNFKIFMINFILDLNP